MLILRTSAVAVLGATLGLLVVLRGMHAVPSQPVIAFVPRTTGTNLAEDMHRGARAAAQGAGYRLYWNGPTREDDVDRQIQISQAALDRGARALILGPTNPRGLTTMVNRIQQRGIPVVVVQTEPPVPTNAYVTAVTPDQEQFGRLAADRVVQITGGTGQVAILGLDRAAPETLVRAKSFVYALRSHAGIEVVQQVEGTVQILEAEQSARAMVLAHPGLSAIFTLSADATQGAVLALNSLNPKPKIALIGCDKDLFLADSLVRGEVDSLIGVDAYRVGYLAAQDALIAAGGKPLPPPQYVSAMLFTRKNVNLAENRQ